MSESDSLHTPALRVFLLGFRKEGPEHSEGGTNLVY